MIGTETKCVTRSRVKGQSTALPELQNHHSHQSSEQSHAESHLEQTSAPD